MPPKAIKGRNDWEAALCVLNTHLAQNLCNPMPRPEGLAVSRATVTRAVHALDSTLLKPIQTLHPEHPELY